MNHEQPLHPNEIFLQPGELYFGDRRTRVRTLLGSCVSLVFWHPQHQLGGMCHYMLPSRAEQRFGDLDGRYADEAVALMFGEMRRAGTHPAQYQVKMFGGANMFPGHGDGSRDHVGSRNINVARAIVREHGLACVSEHLAGAGHRNLIFDVWSGRVWVKHRPVMQLAGMTVPSGESLACAA